ANTIIVLLAFMATKSGSRVRNWVGRELTISIVLFCSFIQAVICKIWLATFPPFPEMDLHSETTEGGPMDKGESLALLLIAMLPADVTFPCRSCNGLSKMWFPYMACHTEIVQCTVSDLPIAHHRYFQTEDVIIGAITSLFLLVVDMPDFKENPILQFIEKPISLPKMEKKIQKISLYEMVPNQEHQYEGIRQLLLHFRWIWIGVLVKEELIEGFQQNILPLFSKSGICFEFLEKLKPLIINTIFDRMKQLLELYEIIMNSKANTVIVYEENQKQEEKPPCCYDCIICPEGKSSGKI
ncbi:hypothetical protein E2320_003024, partial [Naja naja]